jgi:hypothetical protein
MQWGGAGTYYWGQPIQQGPWTHLCWMCFSTITPISPAQCTSLADCPDLCTLYTLFLSFLCAKPCVYEDQNHFIYLCWLLILLPPCSGFLLACMSTAPPEWQFLCTNQCGRIPLEDFILLQHCCDNLECCLLNDNPTNAHLQICTITYYSSATCFGHLCDHHRDSGNKNTINIQ